jgi:hypothetical protein
MRQSRDTLIPAFTPHHLRKFQDLPCGNPAGYPSLTCTKSIGDGQSAVNETGTRVMGRLSMSASIRTQNHQLRILRGCERQA